MATLRFHEKGTDPAQESIFDLNSDIVPTVGDIVMWDDKRWTVASRTFHVTLHDTDVARVSIELE